jgi:hypothetical protein
LLTFLMCRAMALPTTPYPPAIRIRADMSLFSRKKAANGDRGQVALHV